MTAVRKADRMVFRCIPSPWSQPFPLAHLPRAWSKFKELGAICSSARTGGRSVPDLSRQAPDNPDFARVLELRALPEAEDFVFDIAPEAAE